MVILLILAVLCCSLLQVTTVEITCYECTDNPDGTHTYDSLCGSYHYQGHTENRNGSDTCGIQIFDNGHIYRFIAGNIFYDGECYYDGSNTACFCKGVLCNTDSFCAQCGYPRPTPGTTEATTTTVTTTPAPPTTDATTTMTTTSDPVHGVKCFSCVGCFNVEEGTTPVVEDGFTSCMTTVYWQDRSQVIRGGSYQEHPDGECIGNTEQFSCWCSTDLCNADAMDM
ncbi:unnamed protein product [Meganyctiphanes norvegica]|uniref:Uncharacterized protein n=1 Tax=Meganyctiphanes norvegica TaxID=48144 RepID=A0AAV2S0J9_MEGNR